MPHKVTTSAYCLQEDPHFPFLDLPLELQVNILSFIDDLETLRSCLCLPQVLSAVSSQLRYITNIQGSELTYFRGIDKWVKRTNLYRSGHRMIYTDTNIGYIYLVEFQFCPHLHFYANMKELRNTRCFIAITDVTDQELVDRYLRLTMNGNFCAVGVFGKTSQSITM